MHTRRAFVPKQHRTASVRTLEPNDGTIQIVFTTGADVTRSDPLNGTYIERLLTGPENVRLDRLNAGAPFLDTHVCYSLGSIIGSVVPGSARMEIGQGVCDILLSRAARAADTVTDILSGVIKNVSVGYDVSAYTRVEASEGSPALMIATDWTPLRFRPSRSRLMRGRRSFRAPAARRASKSTRARSPPFRKVPPCRP